MVRSSCPSPTDHTLTHLSLPAVCVCVCMCVWVGGCVWVGVWMCVRMREELVKWAMVDCVLNLAYNF